jgi:hypothetical protein
VGRVNYRFNILVMRRVGALLLLVPGGWRLVSRLTGEPVQFWMSTEPAFGSTEFLLDRPAAFPLRQCRRTWQPAIRYPLSAIRYPLSAIRYPLSKVYSARGSSAHRCVPQGRD